MKKLITKLPENHPSQKNSLLAIFIFFIFALLLSLPFWFQGKIPFPSDYLVNDFAPWQYYYGLPVKNPAMPDIGSQIFPWRFLSIEALRNRQWPLWNPFAFAGTPLLANFQSSVFHPANFLFLILPTIKAWSLMILLPLFLTPLFTFWYLREIKISFFAALFASFSFSFCGFMICWLAYGTLPWAILWLSLALMAIEKFKKGFFWAGPLLSLTLAFSLFSGHFQISLYFLGVVFLYLLSRKATGKLFLFFVLGVLLSLPQLLPTIEFYQQSIRSQSFRVAETIPLNYLITLLAPDFFGNPVTRNHWFGHYAEWNGFIGVVPLILASYGLLFYPKRFFLKFFAFLIFLSLLVAVRSPIQPLLVSLRIPVFSTSSFSRIIVLSSFGLAVAAAFGLEQLQEDWQKARSRRIFLFLFGLSLFFIFVWGLIFAQFIPQTEIARRNFLLPSLFFGGLSVCFLSGVWFKGRSRRLLLVILLVLTMIDLFRFSKKWLPFDPAQNFYPQLELIKVLEEKTTLGERVFGNFGSELSVFKIPGIEGYDPLYPQRYGELITSASDGELKEPSLLTVLIDKQGKYTYKYLNLLGVKYLLQAKEDGRHVWVFPFWQHPESFAKIWEDGNYEIYLNREALPRAFLVEHYLVEKQDQKIIDLMMANDLSKTVILEEEPTLSIEPCSQKGEAQIIDYGMNRIRLKTASRCPELLFLSDNFYPGWQSLIDGKPTKIMRANYSFRSVALSAGEHQVDFIYQPSSFRLGLIGSGIGLILLLLISFIYKHKRNENRFF